MHALRQSVESLESGTLADSEILATLEKLYAVISFEENEQPDWLGLRAVFSAHARITRITPEGTDYLDPKSFCDMVRNLVELGAYTSFYEFEIARRIERFGNIAQVWSLYETRRSRGAREALGRGVNSIQLIQEPEGWRVLGLLWDEIHSDPRLERSAIFGTAGQHGQSYLG